MPRPGRPTRTAGCASSRGPGANTIADLPGTSPNRPRGTHEYRPSRRWGPPAGIRVRGNTTMRMRTAIAAGVKPGAAALVLGAAALTATGPNKAGASSHPEAPLIAKDPTPNLTH